jgi:hypothetical protein
LNTKTLGPLGLCIASTLGACRTAQAPSSERAAASLAVDAAVGPSGCPAGRKLVWHGELSSADWLHTWDPDAKIAHGSGNAEVIADPRFGHALRVRYPAGSSSSSYARKGHPEGGLEFMAKLPGRGLERALFSYWLKFDDHFDWVRGGKLPGVCGGSCPSGGADVTGVGGWSMRYMWRPGGDGEQYAYVVPPRAYGTELGLGAWTFTKGGWHRIIEELVLNTNGSANGVSRVWYDADPAGPPTFEEKNMTFRLDSTPVSTLFFSTFFGGHDASWVTPADTFVDFADLVVCE